MPRLREYRIILGVAQGFLGVAILCAVAACGVPNAEERERDAAAAIEASIQDFDGPALSQEVERKVVVEVQTHLTEIKEYMGEINGEIDPVLVNAIQAFQRAKDAEVPWWKFWQHRPNDGLITDLLRQQLKEAAAP